jgi:stage II sporulation protein B
MKMDKSNKGNTITIKINRKDLPPKEQDDTPVQSKIREKSESHLSESGEQESAAAKEPIEEGETFEWILPAKKGATESKQSKNESIEKIEESKSKSKLPPFLNKVNKSEQSKKGMFTPIFLSIFFAVLVGTTFGLTMLKMVPPEQVTVGEQPVVGTEQKEETPIAAGTVELALPSLSGSVVQESVYTSQESAEQIKNSLKERGIPAEVFSVDGKFALFIGVAQNVEAAKVMGQAYKASGTDTFTKEFIIEEKTVSNLKEEEKKLLELAPPIYQTLVTSLSNGIPTELKASFEQQSADLTKIDKNKIQNKEMIILYSELEAATAQLKKYGENPDPKTLTLIQQHLLSFLSSYQRL